MMMKKIFLVALVAVVAAGTGAQEVSVKQGRFRQGDDMSWAKPELSATCGARRTSRQTNAQ